MQTVSFRVPEHQVAELRELAHRKSLRTGREIKWTEIVREHLGHVVAQERAELERSTSQ